MQVLRTPQLQKTNVPRISGSHQQEAAKAGFRKGKARPIPHTKDAERAQALREQRASPERSLWQPATCLGASPASILIPPSRSHWRTVGGLLRDSPFRQTESSNSAKRALRCRCATPLNGAWVGYGRPCTSRTTCADAYVREALASDPETNKHNPPCFRSPNGALEDSFYLATGRQLWDASFIYVPTLVLASEWDFWSRPADRDKIAHDLVHATVRVVVIPNATHFVHLDKPERGRGKLLEETVHFLQQSTRLPRPPQ